MMCGAVALIPLPSDAPYFLPISRTCSTNARPLSLSSGRLANNSMRRRSTRNASRKAFAFASCPRDQRQDRVHPSGQSWAGLGQTGQTFAAAWSQTVNTKSSLGVPWPRKLQSSSCCAGLRLASADRAGGPSAIGWTAPFGWLPALNPRNFSAPDRRMIDRGLGQNRSRRVTGADEEDVEHATPL